MLQVSSVSFFSLSMNTRYASSVAFAAKIVEQRNIESSLSVVILIFLIFLELLEVTIHSTKLFCKSSYQLV